jgi:hypothetical protein
MVGEGGMYRRQISPHDGRNKQNGGENGHFPALVELKIAENTVFCSKKYLVRYTPKMFVE